MPPPVAVICRVLPPSSRTRFTTSSPPLALAREMLPAEKVIVVPAASVPVPAVLPIVPPDPIVIVLATDAPLLMFKRLAPTAIVPTTAAPLPERASVPLEMSVVPPE